MQLRFVWIALGIFFLYGCNTQTGSDTRSGSNESTSSETPVVQTDGQPEVRHETSQDLATPLPVDGQATREIEEIVVTGAQQGVAVSKRKVQLAAVSPAHAALYRMPQAYQDYGRDQYERFEDNGWQWSESNSVSTFSVDVDTASYTNLRRSLSDGYLPPGDAVRVEEFINYFNYHYPAPDGAHPFGIYQEFGPSPWSANQKLLHIGINTTPPAKVVNLPPANLVFLVDVSGSMQAPNKLHLLKRALKMLTKQMRPQDRIAMVVYAGAAGTVLESTAAPA